MNHKVLLADDSLTIQKVIKITLANQPYDITDCSNEDELFHQLAAVQPKLVLLDFNLSERYTGYELTTKIKSLSPSTKVLILLGTFDSVDDAALEKCGASDKIVKPFDSNKFIAICKQLIETFADNDIIPFPEKKSEEEEVYTQENSEDQWTVSHSTEQKFEEKEKELDNSFPNLQNPLHKEMSDWGMSVPGIIDDPSSAGMIADLPPVIAEVKSLREHQAQKGEFEQKFPQNDDLDYPTMEELTSSKNEAPVSKLISIDSFNDSSMDLEMEGSYIAPDSDVSAIEAQIRDEVEDNLWHADEFEDLKKEVSAKIEEVKNNFQPTRNDFDESLFKPLDEEETIHWHETADLFKKEEPVSRPVSEPSAGVASVDMELLKTEMEAMVKKYVKEYMDEMFKKDAEKIAWEVIPDLAENLIRQELSKISNKILNDQN